MFAYVTEMDRLVYYTHKKNGTYSFSIHILVYLTTLTG